ncbi:MAG TPA: hypothetical protein VGE98_14715 [Thermoanaerobaculia bacterium]
MSERITRWDTLVTNLKTGINDLPHLADDLKALDGLLAQARALESQQEDLRSQARKATATLRDLGKQGDTVRARLGANLRGKFGFTDETLIKFGFKPRPIVRRKSKKGTATTPAPATPAPTTPAPEVAKGAATPGPQA